MPLRVLAKFGFAMATILPGMVLVRAAPLGRLQQGTAIFVRPAEMQNLELGKPIERKVSGGQTHTFQIEAQAGQFLHVVAEQRGIEVVLEIISPDGKSLIKAHTVDAHWGPEPASVIADVSGTYRVRIEPSDRKAGPGKYVLSLTELRAPMAKDQVQIAAEHALFDSVQITAAQLTAKSIRRGIAEYSKAAALWKEVGDSYEQALALSFAGRLCFDAGERPKALDYFDLSLDYYRQALRGFQAAGDQEGEAATLTNIAFTYVDLGQKQEALNHYYQALADFRDWGDPYGKRDTFKSIGKLQDDLGEKQEALALYGQARQFSSDLGDRQSESDMRHAISGVYSNLGDNRNDIGLSENNHGERESAVKDFKEALQLYTKAGNVVGEATELNNIGQAYDNLGEKEKALGYYNQALLGFQAAGDQEYEATTLNNIAALYDSLGEKRKALRYYLKALEIFSASGTAGRQAETLNNIGWLYYGLGQKQRALAYYNQALPIEHAAHDRSGEAMTLNNIGKVYSGRLGQRERALLLYNKALGLWRGLGDRDGEAMVLKNIGEVYIDLGEIQKALDYYSESLPLFRAVQDPLGEGRDLVLLMEYWKDLSNPNLAILFGKEAIDRFQQVRRNIGGLDQGTQQSFLKSKEDYYRELAELLISQGRLPEAQQVLDLLKAEEYSDFTQRRGNTGSDTSPVALTPMEEKSNQEYEQITTNITAIGSEWTQLRAKSSRSPDEEKRYNLLSNNLTAANLRLQTFMKGLYESFGKGDQANAKVENLREETAGLQNLVAELGGGTMAVYTLVTDHKLVEMVITPAASGTRSDDQQDRAARQSICFYPLAWRTRFGRRYPGEGARPLQHSDRTD